MKILVVDVQGLALDWILRCEADGHEVRWYFPQTAKTEHIGRGLVKIIPEWQSSIKWADLVVLTDATKFLREMDRWRAEGVKVIGATVDSAEWELSRRRGMQILEKNGIDVPEYKEFSNYDQAIAYVKKQDRAFVSKPCGDEPDKSLSYVAKAPADLVYMLERWKKAQRHKGSFILQEVVKGVEMAVGGWFGPGGFNAGWCENWEEKKLMNGNLGPSTGEQGTSLRVVRSSKLAQKVLMPLVEELARTGHTGYVDVNCMIDEKGKPWPLEFTMRMGWPLFQIQQALHNGDHADWLDALAEGRDARNWTMDEIALGVVMAIPDYPYSHMTRKNVIDIPIYGLKPSIMEQVHPCEIKMGEAPFQIAGKVITRPCWVTAGDYVLIATATGETVRLARERCYRVLSNLKQTPGSPFWRTDIGTRLKTELPSLQTMGYALAMEY